MPALWPSPPPPLSRSWPRRDARAVWNRVTYGLRVKLLVLALVKDPDRRRSCRTNFLRFCLTYFPAIFFDPNRFHLETAAELQRLFLAKAPTLQLKALAAPRGIGKTTLCVLFVLWAAIYGHARFALILCDNADHADERLAALKSLVLTSEKLYEDFPEICGPVRAFGGDARAAAGITPEYPWSKDLVRLANGPWIASYGMDSGIAGRLKNFTRPDLLLIDDAESVDTVKSPAETARLRDRLFQEVMKLPGAGMPALLVWICTIKIKGCLGDELTDAKLNPEWRGQRYPGLEKLPTREDLWNYFMELIRPDGRGEAPTDAALPPKQEGN